MTAKRARLGAFFLVLLAVWSGFIFIRSSKNSEASSIESEKIIRMIAGAVDGGYRRMSAENQSEYVEGFQFIARKAAHFTAYATLGLLSAAAAVSFGLNPLAGYIYCVFYAASDEIHQYFVPGRSCELRDFLIDAAGALAGLLIAAAIAAIIRAPRKKSKQTHIKSITKEL